MIALMGTSPAAADRLRRAAGQAMIVLVVALAGLLVPASARADDDRRLFTIKDQEITESSGLAASPTHKGIVYTHNDSGGRPQIFALGPDGRTRATFTIAGATARDWEGMAATVDPKTGRGVLWIGDIGDNLDAWSDISVYKVTEPRTMADATLTATRYRFRYKDGARNAEGLMVDPRTSRLYIVSKEISGSIYQAPAKLRTDQVNVLRRVGSAPIMATDAAFAPDGSSFVIRTYFSASVYRSPDHLIAHVSMPPLDQAESVTYTRDGADLLTGSEGKGSPVYEVPLPSGARPRTTPSASARPAGEKAATPEAAPAGTSDGGVSGLMIALWAGVAAGAIGIIGVIAWRTAR
jgi:hypothetical protein